jgi:hypothetical protein
MRQTCDRLIVVVVQGRGGSLWQRLAALEHLEQRLACTSNTALDSPDGTSADRGRFLVREAAHAHEDERGPLPGRE